MGPDRQPEPPVGDDRLDQPASDEAPSSPLPPRWRWSRALLLLGVVAAVLPMAGALPRSRPIEVQLTDPKQITRLELLWIDPDDGQALGEGRWTFAPGTAPPSLRTRISASPGTYRVQIRVNRGDARHEDQRWVEFGWRDVETRLIIR